MKCCSVIFSDSSKVFIYLSWEQNLFMTQEGQGLSAL